MVRKTRLNQEIIKEVSDCISLGMSYAATAGAIGVTPETFQNWLKWGKEANKDPIYSQFLAEVRSAESRLMHDCLLKLRKSAETGNIETVKWILERRYPLDYGKKNSLDIRAQTESVNVNVSPSLTEAENNKLRAEILAKLSPREFPPRLDVSQE